MKHHSGLFLAAGLALVSVFPTHAEDLFFEVENATGVALAQLYISPVEVDNQVAEVLGGKALMAGEAIDIAISSGDHGCAFNILGVFADGENVEGRDVDLCELESYTFSEN